LRSLLFTSWPSPVRLSWPFGGKAESGQAFESFFLT
jgi:hypothetical protein